MLHHVKLRSSDLLPSWQFSIDFDSYARGRERERETDSLKARARPGLARSLLILSVTFPVTLISLTVQIKLWRAAYAANKLHPTAFPDVWIVRQRIQTLKQEQHICVA